MDNQQRRLQQELTLHNVDINSIQLSKKYLPTNQQKLDFLSDLQLVDRDEMVIKHNLPNIGIFNNIVLKYYSYIKDLPLPPNFTIASLYTNTDYAISPDGHIFTIKTRKLVTPYSDEFGYLRVNVRHYKPHTGNQGIYERLHRLLCMTFKPCESPHLYEVNHIDGNKFNNSLTNLEWVTQRENLDHAWINGLRLLPSQYRILNSQL